MCVSGWCVIMCIFATIPLAQGHDNSSSEELRQALVLVDILRKGYARRKSPIVQQTQEAMTPLTTFVPWPPPPIMSPFYEYNHRDKMAPLYAPMLNYGLQLRRLYGNAADKQDAFPNRRFQNIRRQIQYDDPFGPHPGTSRKEKEEPISTQTSTENPQTSGATVTNVPSTGITESSTTRSTLKRNIASTKTAMKQTTAFSIADYEKPNKQTITTRSNKKTINAKSITSTTNIMKLNYMKQNKISKKNSKDRKVKQNGDELELTQVAEELKREVADTAETLQPKCGTITSNTACTSHSYPWRFRATTRIYLSRSFRPQIPLPENNAFCHTNPESPLCRTFI
ncbi:uncharacterized protein [Battus philenor]|uniref:uncharacterized protein n=1 Tax=Battus philenor TaxID=42288 RepID=UPI0035D0B194